jgi:DNA-binding MarR family transcriptional regulator
MRLIWAVDHELQSLSKRMQSNIGLTVPQRMTLLLIGRQPGILASEIAALLHLHQGTMSGVVRRLESAGYVERIGDDGDARRMCLTLTARGRKANGSRAGTYEAAVRRVLAATSAKEFAAAEQLLTRLARALHETVDEQRAAAKR